MLEEIRTWCEGLIVSIVIYIVNNSRLLHISLYERISPIESAFFIAFIMLFSDTSSNLLSNTEISLTNPLTLSIVLSETCTDFVINILSSLSDCPTVYLFPLFKTSCDPSYFITIIIHTILLNHMSNFAQNIHKIRFIFFILLFSLYFIYLLSNVIYTIWFYPIIRTCNICLLFDTIWHENSLSLIYTKHRNKKGEYTMKIKKFFDNLLFFYADFFKYHLYRF